MIMVVAVCLSMSCGTQQADTGPPVVAVSIFPIYDLARQVAGDRLDVVLVLPPGRSEHGFEPTPKEMVRVSGADLGLVVGLEMDRWAERIIHGAAGSKVPVVPMAPRLNPRSLSAPEVGLDLAEHAHGDHGHDHHGDHGDHGDHGSHAEHPDAHQHGAHASHHGHHHEHGAQDPHFWLDPQRMQQAVDHMVEAFSELDAEGAAGFRERGERAKASLAQLDADLARASAGWSTRTIVTFHGSFGYFAERYDLRIAAVIEPFPGREPTPRYLQEVLTAIEASQTRALFTEPQLDPRPGRVIAEQTGISLFELDPIGGTTGVETYDALMRHNLDVLNQALAAP